MSTSANRADTQMGSIVWIAPRAKELATTSSAAWGHRPSYRTPPEKLRPGVVVGVNFERTMLLVAPLCSAVPGLRPSGNQWQPPPGMDRQCWYPVKFLYLDSIAVPEDHERPFCIIYDRNVPIPLVRPLYSRKLVNYDRSRLKASYIFIGTVTLRGETIYVADIQHRILSPMLRAHSTSMSWLWDVHSRLRSHEATNQSHHQPTNQ